MGVLSGKIFRFIESARAVGVFFAPLARIEQAIFAFDYVDERIKLLKGLTNTTGLNDFSCRVFGE